jgi:hypothetical protein
MAEQTIRNFKIYAWDERAKPAPTNFVPVNGRPWT